MQRRWSTFKSPHDFEVNMGSLEDVQEMYYLLMASFLCGSTGVYQRWDRPSYLSQYQPFYGFLPSVSFW